MKQNKKAELSINMIIVIVLAIMVLVIVVSLLIRQSGSAQRTISCPSLGGVCTARCAPGGLLTTDTGVCTTPPNLLCCNPLSAITT